MKLRVAVLDNAWENWNVPGVRDLFSKVITLKNRGYGKEYPSNVLSVDVSDYFGQHHLVCEESAWGDLTPLMAYKIVDLSRARRFNATFGGLALMRAINATEHEASIKLIIERAQATGREISYDSSWTIDPVVRQDRDLVKHLREIMQAIHVLHHTRGGAPEVVAAGSTRFKMERLYHYWGYSEIESNGRILPAVKVPAYAGEEAIMFHVREFSKQSRLDAQRFTTMWDDRLCFGTMPGILKIDEAA